MGVWFGGLPDFSNPSKGFAVKGTQISNRKLTKLKLENEVKEKNLNLIYDMIHSDNETRGIRKSRNLEKGFLECKNLFGGKLEDYSRKIVNYL